MSTSTHRKQTDTIINVSSNDLIKIESFDSITHSRYFFNPTTNDILLCMPISRQYKLVKPIKTSSKGHTYDAIFLIPSDNSKRIGKSCNNFVSHIHKTY